MRRIDIQIRRLADFPELGTERLEIASGLRMLVEGRYLILYRKHQDDVEIVRVVHGARDVTTLF